MNLPLDRRNFLLASGAIAAASTTGITSFHHAASAAPDIILLDSPFKISLG